MNKSENIKWLLYKIREKKVNHFFNYLFLNKYTIKKGIRRSF